MKPKPQRLSIFKRYEHVALASAWAVCVLSPGSAAQAADPYSATVARDVTGFSPFTTCTADADAHATPQLHTEYGPRLAVDPTDPQRLAGVYLQDLWSGSWVGRGAGAVSSADGGASWSTGVLPGLTVCSGGAYARVDKPSLAFGPTGTVHSIALARSPLTPAGRDHAVMVNRSSDGGRTWDAPVTLFSDTEQRCHYGSLTIVADPTDGRFVYASWTRGRFPGRSEDWEHGNPHSLRRDVFFARSTDGGRTWEPSQLIFAPRSNEFAHAGELVALPDGQLLHVFTLSKGMGHDDVAVMRSTDHGATWSQPAPISSLTNRAVVDPDDGEPVRTGEYRPDVGVDPVTGRVFVAWQDARFSDGERSAIALASTGDGGRTWSAARRVNGAPATQAFNPAVAVGRDGTVAVSYSDFRDDVPAADVLTTGVWLAHSHDGGETWTENRLDGFDLQQAPKAYGGLFLGDDHGLVALPDGFGLLHARPSAMDAASVRFIRATS